MSVNKVIIVGNLTKPAETRFLPNGDAVSNFSLATNEVWKDKQGNKQQKAEYHNIVTYRKLGEICGEYLVSTGMQVYIEGKLTTRSWEKDGIKRYTTEIIADTMQMLGGGKKSDYSDDGTQSQPQSSQHNMKATDDVNDISDDIPW